MAQLEAETERYHTQLASAPAPQVPLPAPTIELIDPQLVDDVIAEAEARFDVTFEEVSVARETVYFKLPRALLV